MAYRHHPGDDRWIEADVIPPDKLKRYLCSLANGISDDQEGGRADVMAGFCRQCESQCAFGRRLVEVEKTACAPTQTAKKGPTKGKGQTHDNTRKRKAQGAVAGGL